jgi:hypothetical protein
VLKNQKLMKKITLFVCLIATMMTVACSSTKITNSWREPDKILTISQLNKVLVVALFNNETNRRKAEDQMAGYLKGKGVVSYNYFSDKFNPTNEEAIRESISAASFDGAVTMRLVDVEKEKIYMPSNMPLYPAYSRNFPAYYYRNYGYSQRQDYYRTTRIYTVETNVYSIKENKIIWSALTQTTDPEGVDKLTGEIAQVVYKKMLKEGFIK